MSDFDENDLKTNKEEIETTSEGAETLQNYEVLPAEGKSERMSLWKKREKEVFDLEGQLNLKFTNENEFYNGEIISADKNYEQRTYYVDLRNPKTNQIFFSKQYTSPVKPLTLDDLRGYYSSHNNSIEETQKYLQNFLTENKANEALIRATVSQISEDLNKHFDHTTSLSGVGGPVEGLEKCINSKNNLSVDGLICGSICDIMRYQLEQCGFKTAIVSSKKKERHAVLSYKLGEGVYVFNDFGQSVVVQADNIKDAVAVFHKCEGQIHSESNLRILDTTATYSDTAYKDSAYRGEEFSKHSYNSENPFNQQDIKKGTSVSADVERTNLNNYSADVTFDLYRDNTNKESQLSISAGMKKMNESAMFHESTSFGINTEYRDVKYKNNLTKTNQLKVLFAHIQGKTGGAVYSNSQYERITAENAKNEFLNDFNNIDKSNYSESELELLNANKESALRIFNVYDKTGDVQTNDVGQILAYFRGSKSFKKSFINNDNFELNGGLMTSADLYYTVTTKAGDVRVVGDAGLEAVLKNDKQAATVALSGGVIAELNEPVDTSGRFVNFGKKLNSQFDYCIKPNNKTELSVNGNAFFADTKGSDNYGAGVSAAFSYREPKKNITFTGTSGLNFEGEKIKLGFNEQTEKGTTFTISAGVSKGYTSIYAGYEKYTDSLDSNMSKSAILAGVKFNIGQIKL